MLGMFYLVTNKIKKSSLFKGWLFSNMTKVILFISNTRSYVPIKLCRIARSIHLFRIRRRLTPENVWFKKNWIWDVLEIDWKDISMILNGNEIHLLCSVIIPFRDKFRARKLLRKQLCTTTHNAKTRENLVYFIEYDIGNPSIANDNAWKQTWSNKM